MAANQGTAPLDPDSFAGQVRLLVGDTDPTVANPVETGKGTYLWYSDEEINGLSALFGNNPRRVAAQVLRSISFSQIMLLKKFTSADLAVDGASIADSIRALARDLDEQADAGDAVSASEAFQIVPTGGIAWETWQAREHYTDGIGFTIEPSHYYPVI